MGTKRLFGTAQCVVGHVRSSTARFTWATLFRGGRRLSVLIRLAHPGVSLLVRVYLIYRVDSMAGVCIEDLKLGRLIFFVDNTVVAVCSRDDVRRLISIYERTPCNGEELVFEINLSTAPAKWLFLTSPNSLYVDNLTRPAVITHRDNVFSRVLFGGGGECHTDAIFRKAHHTLKCCLGFGGPGILLRQESQYVSWEQLRPGEQEPKFPRGMIAPYSLRWDYDLACESGQLLVQAD